eukprot:COSAG02_NODE_7692_length_2891_cov_2.813754_3_plen_186_part_00
MIVIRTDQTRKDVIDGIKPVFQYLRDRVTGQCNACLDYSKSLNMFKYFRIFDPARAVDLGISAADIDALGRAFPILQNAHPTALDVLKHDLSKYLQLAQGFATNRSHMREYTADILRFWRHRVKELNPAWGVVARAVFSIPSSSAASERVFSLLKCMFPEQRAKPHRAWPTLEWVRRFASMLARS